MSEFKKLQEEIHKSIEELSFQHLGIFGRFKYTDFETIENLTSQSISNIGSIVKQVLNIEDLERKLQERSKAKVVLTYDPTSPFIVSRESVLRFGRESGNGIIVHTSHNSPKFHSVSRNLGFEEKYKNFTPFLTFEPRTSVNPLLHNFYFSLNSSTPNPIIEYEPVTCLDSWNDEIEKPDLTQSPFRRRGVVSVLFPNFPNK
ncbi:MAG: hypothetical protein LAT82_00200 [Nanoarchaeota archaeon]|nr:hypothetical protein [Nanoarchaeota archaeon]